MTGVPPGEEFHTWSEIAGYLKISVREAQYRAKSEGLPVHRGAGKKPRVWAVRAEMDAWTSARRFQGSNSQVGTCLAPVVLADVSNHATDGVLTAVASPDALRDREGIAIPGESGRARNPGTYPFANPTTRRQALTGSIFGLGGILATGAGIRSWRRPEIAMFTVEGLALIARDASGGEVWRHLFNGGFDPIYYQPARFARTYWIGDLDGDGHVEALFRYDGAERGENSTLFCFSQTGEVKWIFRPGRKVRDAGGDILPLYNIVALLVCFSAKPHLRARVAVSSVHPTDQACQIAILDASGRLTAEYWHPGHLYLLAENRAGFSGAPLFLAGGVNNGEHRATIVVLDPFAMSGATTPSRMKDANFRLLDMPEAREELVVLFPRSCLSRDEPYTRLTVLEADVDAVRANVAESHDPTTRNVIMYDFDPSLVPSRVILSSEYRQEHSRLERSGALPHSAHVDEIELLKGIEIRRKTA